jgi:hypothetical protein
MELLRFGIFTAVTMKNAAWWDIKTQFIPDSRHVSTKELAG